MRVNVEMWNIYKHTKIEKDWLKSFKECQRMSSTKNRTLLLQCISFSIRFLHEIRWRRQCLQHLRPHFRSQHIGRHPTATAGWSKRRWVSSRSGRSAGGRRIDRHLFEEIGGQHRFDLGNAQRDVAFGRVEAGRRPEGAERREETVEILEVGDALAGER